MKSLAIALITLAACSQSQDLGQDACQVPDRRCAAECVDISSDPRHCGGCDASCNAGQKCAGQCTSACPQTLTDCGGACVNVATALRHCGGCMQACAVGERCRNGSCSSP